MKRRHFLTQSAGVVAVGAVFPGRSRAAEAATPPKASTVYVPGLKPTAVVQPGEFIFAAAHLDHGHITGMCTALIAAGATLKWVFEPDEKKRGDFLKRFKEAKAARSLDEILADTDVKLVASAAVTSERGPLGCRVMEAGKDYFVDKAPLTTLEQLAQARAVVARTGRKYGVYYSERLTSEAGMFATDLVKSGVLGRVVQVAGFGPHRLSKATRPAWFFERAKFGGILCDIGSH